MALIKCTECGNSVSDKAKACPHCGSPVVMNGGVSEIGEDSNYTVSNYYDETSKRKNNVALIGAIVLGLIVVLGVGGWLWHDNQQKHLELKRLQKQVAQDSIAEIEKAERKRLDSIKAAEERLMKMQHAYKEILNKHQSGNYFLTDITGDGVPELWLILPEDGNVSLLCHQYFENQATLFFSQFYNNGDITCYQGRKSLIVDFHTSDNTYSTYKVYYHDGQFIDDMINYDHYPNHKKPSEQIINTYNIKNTSPIIETLKIVR